VRMRVQPSEFLPPASLASSSLEMPVRRWRLDPSVFFMSLFALKVANDRSVSTMPVFSAA